MKTPLVFGLLLALGAHRPGTAQTLPPAERWQLLAAADQLLRERYVFPGLGRQMARRLQANRRAYEAIGGGPALARQLTADLYALAHDKHLHVGYHPGGVPADQVWNAQPTAEQRAGQLAAMREGMRRENFGILDLAVRRYNVGYLSLKYLADPAVAGDSYVAALHYLARTDALILDLRQCGGATSEFAIPLLCSYFLAEPTHLTDWCRREGNRTQQSWPAGRAGRAAAA